MGRLRLANPLEIPDDLEQGSQVSGPGISVLPETETSSDSSSVTDPEDRTELAPEELYSSDEQAEGEVSHHST